MTNLNMEQPSYRLSIEQLAELQQAFNEFDMDGDNFISTKELGWAMRAMGIRGGGVHNTTSFESELACKLFYKGE